MTNESGGSSVKGRQVTGSLSLRGERNRGGANVELSFLSQITVRHFTPQRNLKSFFLRLSFPPSLRQDGQLKMSWPIMSGLQNIHGDCAARRALALGGFKKNDPLREPEKPHVLTDEQWMQNRPFYSCSETERLDAHTQKKRKKKSQVNLFAAKMLLGVFPWK